MTTTKTGNKTGFNFGVTVFGALVALVGVALAGRKGVDRALDRFEGAQPAGKALAGSGMSAPASSELEGHAAPDLAAGIDLGPDHRAPEAFRPNIDAAMTPAEREALRPATGPAPTLAADRGGSV